MGRRPDYFGGSTIEYTKKGKHYDCIYRSIDGDCMKKAPIDDDTIYVSDAYIKFAKPYALRKLTLK